MLLLAVIALIVVGPQKLPRIARTLGQLTRQARNAWQGLQSELQAELDAEHNREIMDSTREMMDKATGRSEPTKKASDESTGAAEDAGDRSERR
jgi:sec-independent protein translocase protein TatB